MIPRRPKINSSKAPEYLATIAAEITGECAGPGRETLRHRIWIHRDGSITAPDHVHDSDAEQVAKALGDDEINLCQYWLRFNDPEGRKGKSATGTPHRTLPGWEMTYESFWTPKAQWTALAGILNYIAFSPINPGWALSYTQTYLEKAGHLPNKPSDHMANLATPWARQQGGYRRLHPVLASELGALLDAGVATDHASLFAILDIEPQIASAAITQLKQWGHPGDLFIRLCYALPPADALATLQEMSAERGKRLPSLLGALQIAIENNPDMLESQVRAFLLGGGQD